MDIGTLNIPYKNSQKCTLCGALAVRDNQLKEKVCVAVGVVGGRMPQQQL
jgi:hypothetical protein